MKYINFNNNTIKPFNITKYYSKNYNELQDNIPILVKPKLVRQTNAIQIKNKTNNYTIILLLFIIILLVILYYFI
uniref:Uncharacterized protein n=1 Tax=viral metagenome TaxID=1070528 RepID=A0A6C0H668_9ZZZZ